MGKGGEKLNLQVENGVEISDKAEGPDTKHGFNGKLIFAIIASALGSSFQHGYNTGVINTPQTVLEEWISQVVGNRTGTPPSASSVTLVWSLAVSIFCVGGMIGGVCTGYVADRFGRKGGLLLNNILVFLATICLGSAKAASSHELLILGRFLIGINSGLNAGLAPMYLAEISPINLRGAVGSVYQLVITISILVAQALGLKYVLGTPEHWPVLFALTAVPALFQVVTLPLCPESPKYLLASKGNEMEAQKALAWLRGSLAVQEEMEQMKAENDAAKLLPKVTVRELLTNRALRIPLIICLCVMIAQQLSGINAVIFFSTSIFKDSGLKDDSATFATMGMGAINVLMTIVSLVLVEKAGRKTLLLFGFGGMAIDTLLLTIAMKLTTVEPNLSYLCIVLVFIYIIMFASGPGSIPWFLVAELFNQSARPTAASLAVCTNWTANFLVGLAFLPITNEIGPFVFIIFVVLNCLFFLFIYKKVPETKNKTIEEISALFRQQSYQ
ncbi:solute carrier family 2, facilitated glucose transporter member 1 isoform X2 [Tribolium castaneum]|uniref:Glucose transporter type 1-like Protein n=1 Tax=Tribolium castaneum TaxID=7070 RepID=D6WL90_TRICA|nr:PREDICTED: solute carrier family 2, facilitated glucose transporter member 1 isoform X2 [Tribolium castaneum]EFA03487.1 Glucose transporter type 1-like Protein [Tribolium castaneum]|eukprot:XP_008193726.1 PREDICTED: solute carrier family 2, facilitated glucose transporter member 1 isoform X2 [Tribolium castaneum]